MTIKSNAPDTYERILAVGAALMLVVVIVAVVRGAPHWATVSALVWAHLATITIALVLTPVMLLRPRGTKLHRQLGWIWLIAMFSTAVVSLFVRQANHGNFSFIHILSVVVIVAVPRAIWAAKNHRVAQHRLTIRATVTGALLIAGAFTLPFGRMLGMWLSGS